MEVVKNSENKTVCHADPKSMKVEIVHKGHKTVIRFLGKGNMRISNN
ncbi:MAG: hypothetical protein ACLSAO_07830 [Anaerovoracaceae bacterium]